MLRKWTCLLAIVAFMGLATSAFAADCSFRGALDEAYCDENKDLVADPPKDPAEFKDPSTLVFTYTPVEDPAVYQDAFADFQAYLEKKTGKRVIYYTVQSNAAEVEAMRSGRLHIAGFSTGPTCYAVNLAGYIPIAVKGNEGEFQGYRLLLITRKDSDIKSVADLKGKRVAHTSASSNSGNLAPRALFPKLGITPDKDYTVVYSGKHDQSILGVAFGDYDAAPVAGDVFKRMAKAGRINEEDFRIVWQSEQFPTSSFGYAHDLKPELVEQIREAFLEYRFTPAMQKTFGGADRFFPVTYQKDWAIIRDIADANGEHFNQAGLEAIAKKEAEAKAKKAAKAKQ
ncbi:phosphonate ABC transporter, periplasmic phosphonate-binding protein [Oleidesulfovibrio alaskensis G20]|jgi:phosphonate transport system substrate-binding protein|uniref:Phosphonate ABC transporter, periplasmic phosphonate-binding protein n=1 Tax=Oleidesulfovibrio alaskensis (strain ATCC BAA-1058 / DSM 17464 / G20) TaxID=207559 RepID=Q30UX3_OLEA2|nr:phosphate/phosphite/phosphonate ABC transporter substrate-binding protein [Oleidesulfovibrio alaskensis]ABB40523.1 phosphonate ABC transporter, periplasmic phosphonate-binding protein [Oleidesulfovibrio alaskensis G20]MBG0774572.1 phosphate/phosphite/phosphonate ABC transporter substrate-binding protein [Oleidesulfovibrio alaskensis]